MAILLFASAINFESLAQCASPSATNKCCGIGIVRVKLYGQFSKTITYNTQQSYYNYYNTTGTCLNKGDTVYMAAQVATYPSQQAYMYIDWNKNDTFESAELLLQKSNIGANDSLYGYFIVPIGAPSGAYRMRIGADYGNLAVTNNPCKVTYGDFWDLQINVNADTNFNITAVSLNGPATLTVGQNDTLALTISNHSDSTLDSVRVSYLFDGTTVTENITGLNLASCAQYTHKFSQTISASSNGLYTLKAWVKYPNGNNPDANINDDTTSLLLCTGVSGTLTVNPSSSKSYTNYHTLNEVAQLLNSCYISGPTIVKIKAGTYTDSAYFNNIAGLSTTNTLTIDGGNATNTKFSSSKTKLIAFNNVSYVTIKNLTIDQTNTLNVTNTALSFAGNITEIHVDSCIIKCVVNKNSSYNIVFGTVPNSTKNSVTYASVTNTNISGGYYGIYMYGDVSNRGHNFLVKNCDISNLSNGTGIYLYYEDSVTLSNNYIYSSAIGLFLYYSDASFILSNKINATSTGMNCYYSNDLLVQNNFVWGTNVRSIYLYTYNSTANVKIYHNTIYNYAPTGAATRYGVYVYGPTVDFRNNIISVQRANSQCIWAFQASNINLSEYNNLNGDLGADMVRINNGPLYTTVKDIQGVNGQNNFVFNQVPAFMSTVSPYNLHLKTNIAPLQGDSLTGVSDDIDGNQRCTIAPQLGADECAYKYSNPFASFSLPDTIFVNCIFTATNLSNKLGKHYYWYIDGTLVSGVLTKDLMSTISNTGSHSIKLEVINCIGTDDTTINFNVYNPSNVPVPSFYASDTVIDENGTITFKNYTIQGPESFNWTVTPGTYGTDWIYTNGTDTNSFQPVITFVSPGNYNICLTATNAIGSSQLCKSIYIKVLQTIIMGSPTYTSASEGRLYDDGGKYGNHGTNKKLHLLIAPCAKDVTIEFDQSKFDLGNASWLGIWDGTDSISGKKLFNNYGFTNNYKPSKLTAKSGSMYIYFYSRYTRGKGFEAKWYSTPGTFPKPSALFVIPDTVYIGSTMDIKATYWDKTYTYSWDYENDGFEDATGWKNIYTFNNVGTQTCRLIVQSCGGIDTVDKVITIVNPSQSPVAAFEAEYSYVPSGCIAVQKATPSKLTLYKIVSLKDKSLYGATGWDWDIQPNNNVVFENGTSQSDQNPDVSFTDTGYYSISLTATNAYGNNVKSITNYFYVSDDYCYPTCSTFTGTEAGISMFNIGDISMVSSIGTADYWDYSSSTTCMILGGKYKFNAGRLANTKSALCKIWIDYNIDGIFQSSEVVYSSGFAKLKTWTATITVPTKSSGKVATGFTKLRIAVVDGNGVAACVSTAFGGEYEDYGIFLVDDFEGPVIKLIGGANAKVGQGLTYTDSGATALDNIDGNVPVMVSTLPLNTQTIGTYTLTFNATDSSGNKAIPQTRYITVTPDATAPYIVLIGNNPDTVDANTSYNDPGVIAYDSVDGNISNNVVRTGTANIAVLGTYQYQYTVADKTGNQSATIARDVIVVDRLKPIITLTAPNPYTIHIGDVYSEPGYKVTDNYSQNLTVNIYPTVINSSKPDTLYITYSCTDSVGNIGTAQRTVIITDNVAPFIKLKVGDTIYIEAGLAFTDPGYTITDDYDTALIATVIGSINTMQLGVQSLTYVATDHSGNSSNKTRTIIVQKTTKPILTINGKTTDSVMQYQSYTDLGITATDNYYNAATLQSLVTITGSVNTSILGTYTLTYSLTDPSNIKADDVSRSVVVYAGNAIQNIAKETFQLYPNPAQEILNLVFENQSNIKQVFIYNQAGQLVYNTNIKNDKSIIVPVNNFAQGLYYIAVINQNGERQIAKFKKE
ncbi:MAG: DUF5011 domain-containing protein [Bacteroidota bacterium]|nr:DUF5011 domain-containing protein [Bacteroidota bacterium]